MSAPLNMVYNLRRMEEFRDPTWNARHAAACKGLDVLRHFRV